VEKEKNQSGLITNSASTQKPQTVDLQSVPVISNNIH